MIAPGEFVLLRAGGREYFVTAGDETVSKLKAGRSRVAVSTDIVPTAEFARNPDWRVDTAAMLVRLRQEIGRAHV